MRTVLQLDDRVDRFLAGGLTGILHGKSASYLSEVMPNTFSMARGYVRDFVARTDFHSPERDVFACLDRKLTRLYRQPPPASTGIALLGDARDAGVRARAALRARALPDRARLVVTSPPYLRVVKYGYYNWMRAWLLGEDPAAIDAALDDAHHRTAYLQFMREVLDGLRPALADDAVVVLVIGDVERDRGPAPDGRGRTGRTGMGRGRTARRLSTGRGGSRRRRGRPEDDQAVGRRGRPGDEARPDPGPRRDRGRPAAGPERRRDAGRLGLAAPPPARRLARSEPGLGVCAGPSRPRPG